MMQLLLFVVGFLISFFLTRNFLLSIVGGLAIVFVYMGVISVQFNFGRLIPW